MVFIKKENNVITMEYRLSVVLIVLAVLCARCAHRAPGVSKGGQPRQNNVFSPLVSNDGLRDGVVLPAALGQSLRKYPCLRFRAKSSGATGLQRANCLVGVLGHGLA